MMLEHVDQLHATGKHIEAYEELKKIIDMPFLKVNQASDPEILWRLARCCHQMASSLENKNPRTKELLDEAHVYANSAYKLSENDFDVLKWTAAVTGTRTDFLGTKEKIEQGNIFKNLLDKALALKPEEYSLLFMRGRFAFSVAGLSWFERKAASTLFATPPEATFDEAIRDFLAVEQLRPGWLDNLLFLAKAYLAKGDKQNAIIYLEQAEWSRNNDENVDEEHSEPMKEVKALLKKHKK